MPQNTIGLNKTLEERPSQESERARETPPLPLAADGRMEEIDARLRQEKVKKFEDFVDRRLKPDLVKAIAQRYLLLRLGGSLMHSLEL